MSLTLPTLVLDALLQLDRDLGRAVVRLVHRSLAVGPHPAAELVSFGSRAVIVVTPTKSLEQRTGVLLVPLSDGRALIAFDDSMTTSRLELMVQDALEEDDLPQEDAEVFRGIRTILRDARRTAGVALRLQNIMVLEFAGRARNEQPGPAASGLALNEGGTE